MTFSISEGALTFRIGRDVRITEDDFQNFMSGFISRDYLDRKLVRRDITVRRALNRNGVYEYVSNFPAVRRCHEEQNVNASSGPSLTA
jgi:hypothetical protein